MLALTYHREERLQQGIDRLPLRGEIQQLVSPGLIVLFELFTLLCQEPA